MAYLIWTLFIFQIITADGLIGSLLMLILTPWTLTRLHSEHNIEKLHLNKLFFAASQFYSLVVCFLSLLFHLGIVKSYYLSFILIMNGLASEIAWLEITQYVVWVFILVASVYSRNLLETIDT